MDLPIETLRSDLLAAVASGPVVVSSPTGSGKSTQVPRWCAERGRVLVVEPRRVACRGLAMRVAELEGTPLGGQVGYAVRDERRAKADTGILYVTTGVALRMLQSGDVEQFPTVILDEFHERSLDLDLLLALFLARHRARLVAMSATLDGDQVAAHLGGVHLHAEGRQHLVRAVHPPDQPVLPDVRGLEDRIAVTLASAPPEGDVLVFLPGKGEIARTVDRLRGFGDWEVLPLHGGLTLQQQARVFREAGRRRVVCATNVAETSVTLPRIRVVIDSGLVRRTRYHKGRGYLTLAPLDMRTPPEIRRESLVPLVLAAAACGAPDLDLPFLDPPKDYAVHTAREELQALGALEEGGAISDRGRALFGLPLDPYLGRLLIEAGEGDRLGDAIDLVAALSVNRPLFSGPRPADPDDDLRAEGCDATALVGAVRDGDPGRHGLDRHALRDARQTSRRLRQAWGLSEPPGRLDRRRLAMDALAAWPGCAHVARRRKKRVAWSNGGTELSLGRDSAVNERETDAIVLLDSRAIGKSPRKKELICTAAMPVAIPWLVAAGLGRDRVASAVVKGDRALARIERVYAGRVIAKREEVPVGTLARQAVAELFLAGRLFKEALPLARDRLEARALHASLNDLGPVPGLEEWVTQRLDEIGLESGEDLALLAESDFLPEDLPASDRARLDREFPRSLNIGDALYEIRYDVTRRVATLEKVRGYRRDPPPLQFLPPLTGWRIEARHKNAVHVLRE
jgi:ATP-dependent helicase HrpB